MQMECEALTSNFGHPKTIALMKEKIGRISDGSSPHCAGALKLGLEKAAKFKSQRRRPPGVQLRCGNDGCGWFNGAIPYTTLGLRISCPRCSYIGYLQCVECRYYRDAYSCTACQGCGKDFV